MLIVDFVGTFRNASEKTAKCRLHNIFRIDSSLKSAMNARHGQRDQSRRVPIKQLSSRRFITMFESVK